MKGHAESPTAGSPGGFVLPLQPTQEFIRAQNEDTIAGYKDSAQTCWLKGFHHKKKKIPRNVEDLPRNVSELPGQSHYHPDPVLVAAPS